LAQTLQPRLPLADAQDVFKFCYG